jgi:hypothetical protein
MKKLLPLLIACGVIFVASAGAQSLVDVAKQTRARQKANPNAKVIDNDVIPSTLDVSSSAPAASSPAASNTSGSTELVARKDGTAGNQEAAKEESKTDAEKASAATEDQKNINLWTKQINDEKKEISQLERELNVAQREAGLHAAVYYADAGSMLRDSGKFAEDNKRLQAEIDTKTQALAAAKQKLADLQEEARKAGVPANQLD